MPVYCMFIYPVDTPVENQVHGDNMCRCIPIKKFDDDGADISETTNEAEADVRLAAVLANKFNGFKGLEWTGHVEVHTP